MPHDPLNQDRSTSEQVLEEGAQDNHSPELLEKLADTLKQQGKLDEAVTYYRKAIERQAQQVDGQDTSSSLPNSPITEIDGVQNRVQSDAVELEELQDGETVSSNDPNLKSNDAQNQTELKTEQGIDHAPYRSLNSQGNTEPSDLEKPQAQSLLYEQEPHKQALVKFETAKITPPSSEGDRQEHHHGPRDSFGAIQVYLDQAQMYCSQKEWAKAIATCQEALQTAPETAEAYKLWGNVLQNQGQAADAMGCYAKALLIEPMFPEVYANVGSLYARQKQWEQAAHYYQKAISANPKFAGAYHNLAKIWGKLNQPQKKIQCLAYALTLDPKLGSAEEHYQLGNILLEQGQVENAMQCFRNAVERKPNFIAASNKLVDLLEQQGNWKAAVMYYRQVLDLKATPVSDGPPRQFLNPATTDQGSKRQPLSVATVQKQNELSAESRIGGTGVERHTTSPASIEDKKRQIQQLLRVVKEKPDDEITHARLGGLYAQKQDWERAIVHFRNALRINPRMPDVYRYLAKVSSQVGQKSRAAECLYQALRLRPDWATSEQFLELGDLFLKEGKIDKAVVCLRYVIEHKPNLVKAYHQLGEAYSAQGKDAEATAVYRQSIENNPQSTESYIRFGNVLLAREQWKGAINCYKRAINLEPNHSDAHHHLGSALVKIGKWEEAIVSFKTAIQLSSNSSWSYNGLGEALLRLNRWEEAANALHCSIKLNPDFNWSYINLGDTLKHLGKIDEAVKTYEKAISLDQNCADSYCRLGGILAIQEKWNEAIISYEKALKIDPDFSLASLGISEARKRRAYLGQEDPKSRVNLTENQNLIQTESIDREQDKTNDNEWVYHYELGNTYSSKGAYSKAIEAFNRAIKIKPDHFLSHLNLGKLLSEYDMWNDAISCFKDAARLNPKSDEVYKYMGEVFEQLENWEEAISAYRNVIDNSRIESSNELHFLVDIHLKLANLLDKVGQLDESIIHYQKTIELMPDSPWAYRGLGNIFLKKSKLNEAIKYYHESIDLGPEAHTYELLASTLEKQGKISEAIASYRNSLIIQPNQKNIEEHLLVLEKKESERLSFEEFKRGSTKAYPLDVIVTPNEVNNHHGTGTLALRIWGKSKHILSIRAFNHYGGEQEFGDFSLVLESQDSSRSEIKEKVKDALNGITVNRIACIPYYPEDVLIILALKELYDVKLCTYIMDDQNVWASGIPDDLMTELLEKSDLRLAISPEVCYAYEQKYNLQFWQLPGVVPQELVQTSLQDRPISGGRGILVGNIWTQRWLDCLRRIIKEAQVLIDWYAKPNPAWLSFDSIGLEADGLIQKGLAPEPELVEILRRCPYSILPTGSSNEEDDRPEIAKLSLPSRIPFILATSGTPIIVIGNRETAAASFVQRFNVGVVCDYDGVSFKQAIEYVCLEENQREMRKNALSISKVLSAEGLDHWLWQSLEKGEPFDLRFERLLPRNVSLGDKLNIDAPRSSGNYESVIVNSDAVSEHRYIVDVFSHLINQDATLLSISTHNGSQTDNSREIFFYELQDSNRPEVFRKVAQDFQNINLNQIFCIPCCEQDIVLSLAFKEIFGIELYIYMIDNSNIQQAYISAPLMEELVAKSKLRFVASSELRDALELKYGCKFWVLPPGMIEATENQHSARKDSKYFMNADTTFSQQEMRTWLWKSLNKGEPFDLTFEHLFPRSKESLIPYVEPPAPKGIWREFIPIFQSMRRIKENGFSPDFIIDVGASTGIWSDTINKLFPEARFILIDPLLSHYPKENWDHYIGPHNNFEVIEAAVSNHCGSTSFQVSPDLYGSSLLEPDDGRSYKSVDVEIITLDNLKKDKDIQGIGVLKIDVQCAEHLVLEGAKKILQQIEVIVIELSLIRFEEDAKTFREMLNLLKVLGFRYFDDSGDWRDSANGTLLQKDVLVVRDSFLN